MKASESKNRNRKAGLVKASAVSLAILVLLALLAGYAIRILDENNLGPQVWIEAPIGVKMQSIELEIERLWHRIRPPALEIVHPVTPETLRDTIRTGADWILRMQMPSGRFRYWYDPVTERFSPAGQDNFLRQAGTCYALLHVYEVTGDVRYLNAAHASMGFLERFYLELDGKAYFIFGGKAKLGGTALPMLCMLQIRKLTGTRRFDEQLHRLTDMILDLQYDTGRYKSTYIYNGDYEYETTSGWESNIYPGEAMLALARMYETFGDTRCRMSIDKALQFYDESGKWKPHAFLPWPMQACAVMYKLTGNDIYADYAYQFTDRLLTQQNLDSDDEVYGSFHGIPTVNAGSYLEGLTAAWTVAEKRGDTARAERYRKHALIAFGWLLKLQYPTDRLSPAAGGFQKSLVDLQLRIDNTQHAVTACAHALNTLFASEDDTNGPANQD
jgi:hypothetical protein